ncbi:presumed portal vertex protein [Pseudomonas aeruginosa]|nr:presumed portal vertex protein [Pseudomonas aeruginosa]VTL98585.1 presumed portal vertex protein [Pseudomonas aeruginosa]
MAPRAALIHLRVADINQEVYGLPEWLPALQSALLNESATLFRRKYYQNGSHAGFILYMTDAAQNEDFVTDQRNALKNSKGPGNFRNLFMYAPNGKKDGLQLIPISEVAAKDDFGAIKNISRDDQLAMLRIPPQLMGVVPQNAGGSVRSARRPRCGRSTSWSLSRPGCGRSTTGWGRRWCGSCRMSYLGVEGMPSGADFSWAACSCKSCRNCIFSS